MNYRFKELKIWQSAMEIAGLTYEWCAAFPDDEKFGLISQMHRAAVSMPSLPKVLDAIARKISHAS